MSNSLTCDLPVELHYHLLTFLDAADLCKVRRLNTYWYSLADSDSLWKRFALDLYAKAESNKTDELDWKTLFRELSMLGLNPKACGKNIAVSENNFVATKYDDHKYSTVVGTRALVPASLDDPNASGKYYWEIDITNMQLSGCLCVGVVNTPDAVNHPSESHGMFGHYSHGWGLFSDGERCHNASWYRPAYPSFSTGDKVAVLVDFTAEEEASTEDECKHRRVADEATEASEKTATITFFINGVSQGVAFKDVKGPLYPAFAIKRKGEGVRINVDASLKFLAEEKKRQKQASLEKQVASKLTHQQQGLGHLLKDLQVPVSAGITVSADCP